MKIEPKYKICPFHHCIYKKEYDCDNCDDREWKYPEITDSILLNLLCIINKYGNIVSSYNIEKLRDEILIKTITLSKDIDIKPQVRALFLNK